MFGQIMRQLCKDGEATHEQNGVFYDFSYERHLGIEVSINGKLYKIFDRCSFEEFFFDVVAA